MLQGFSKRSLWYQRACGCLPCSQRCPLCVAACGQSPSSAPSTATTDFVGFGESGAHRARAHRTAERLRGGRPVRPGRRPSRSGGWARTGPPTRRGAERSPIPSPTAATTRGWSASGAGGIVYAVVAGLDARRSIRRCSTNAASGRCRPGTPPEPSHSSTAPPIDGADDRRPGHRDHHRRRGWHRNAIRMRTRSPPIWATTSRSSPSSAIRARRILHSARISRRNCW